MALVGVAAGGCSHKLFRIRIAHCGVLRYDTDMSNAHNTASKFTAAEAAEYARILAPQQTAAEMLPAQGTWSTPAKDYAHGVAIRAILDTATITAGTRVRGH